MNEEVDFSGGERGKFYRPGTTLHIPVYLDDEVQRFVEEIATAKSCDLSSVVNDLLRSDMQLSR